MLKEIHDIVGGLQGPKQDMLVSSKDCRYFVDRGHQFVRDNIYDFNIYKGPCLLKSNSRYGLCQCLADCKTIHIHLVKVMPMVLMLREEKQQKILRNKITIGMEMVDLDVLSDKICKSNEGYEVEKVETLSTLKILDHKIEYSIPINILGKTYYKVPGIETRRWYTFTKDGFTSKKPAKMINIPHSYYFLQDNLRHVFTQSVEWS